MVSTEFVGPGDPLPELDGEVVVKPTISAGARDTGRFSACAHAGALALVARLREEGRTAMVQPYLPAVEEHGETAIVFIGGEISHVLRKGAVLGADEEAPIREEEAAHRSGDVGPGAGGGRRGRRGRSASSRGG